MNHEYRIDLLEKALAKQRRISLVLMCVMVSCICMGTTAVVSESMTISNSKSKPVFVQLVDNQGRKIGGSTAPLVIKENK